MKKHILFAFFTSLILILNGCGSNDKIDSSDDTAQDLKKTATLQAVPIVPDGRDFTIKIPVVKNISSAYTITMKNFILDVDGCTLDPNSIRVPSSLTLAGGIGSIEEIELSGRFLSNCTPSKYTLQYDQTVSDGTQSKSSTIIFDSGASSSGGGGVDTDDNYYFYNTNTPLKISTPNRKYTLKVQLAQNSFVSPGKSIRIHAFSNLYGNLLKYEETTGADGYANFEYTSPDPLPGNGLSVTLTAEFMDENNKTIMTDLLLVFDSNGSTTGDINTTLPIAIVPLEKRTVTLVNNKQNLDIAIKVFKDTQPYTQGNVKVELPSEVLDGIDVGVFEAYTVPVDSQGIALFHYTGPTNLQALIDNNHLGSVFKFYHDENSAPESRQPMNVVYQPGSSYVPMDYRLIISTQNNDFSMGIPELTKTLNVVLQKSDGSDLAAGDATITKVEVTAENASIAQIYDTETGTLVDSLVLQSTNSSPFVIKSKKLSGIVPLRAKVDFTDVNGDAKTLETIINIRVMSGPPSAISISYVSTGQDTVRAKYIERFAITVTDEYGNNVNTRPYISLGAIAGYAVDGREASSTESNNTKRLFYGRDDIINSIADGSLNDLSDSDPSTTQFEETIRIDTFKYVNAEGANTDKLVVFGAGKNYEAMGKWDFEKIDDTTLKLQDDYFGIDRSGLSYAIGHNYYQDQCRQDGREWIGSAASDTYQIDDQGTVVVDYRYDYHLAGKDVMVWVNLDGIQPDTKEKTKIGEVVKHTLRSAGLVAVPSDGYKVPKGTAALGRFDIWHENAPERYRNAHFGWRVKSGSTCAATVVASSNNRYQVSYDVNGTLVGVVTRGDAIDARTCDNGGSSDGSSYITFYLEAPVDKDCTFAIESIMVSSEF